MKKNCVQCGKMFNITQSEIDFYNKKGLQIPKRCKQCRNNNRIKNNTNTKLNRYCYEKNNNHKKKYLSSKIFYLVTILVLATFGLIELGTYIGNYYYNVQTDNITFTETTKHTNIYNNETAPLEETSQIKTINETTTVPETTTIIEDTTIAETIGYIYYTFRNDNLLNNHYIKHGIDMGFASAKDYEKSANDVINNPNSLHKLEAEDNDDIYYLEDTQEFVVLSTDGYIRTYYYANLDYFNRQ